MEAGRAVGAGDLHATIGTKNHTDEFIKMGAVMFSHALKKENCLETIEKYKSAIKVRQERTHSHFEVFAPDFIELVRDAHFFLDVGAEYGFYTFLAAREMPEGGVIYALEADPCRFVTLFEACAFDSTYHGRVFCCNYCVADKNGEAELYQPANHRYYSASVVPDFSKTRNRKLDDADNLAFHAPSITLDSLFAERPVDVVKMDIEGAELLAIEGMRRILESSRPAIFLELHRPQIELLREGGTEYLCDMITDFGYTFYGCEAGGARKRIDPSDVSVFFRLCLVHGSKDPWASAL